MYFKVLVLTGLRFPFWVKKAFITIVIIGFLSLSQHNFLGNCPEVHCMLLENQLFSCASFWPDAAFSVFY